MVLVVFFLDVSWLIVGFKCCWSCLLRGKDIVFTFIIEYNNLMDFGAYVIGLFLYEDLKTIFWLVLKLEIIEL